MTKILYVGNCLSKYGNTPGVIETLGKKLEAEGFTIYYAGTQMNKAKRLIEMLWKTFKYRNTVDFVLIDTYSTNAFWFSFLVGCSSRFFGKKYIPILHGGNLPTRLKNSKYFCDLLFKHSYQNVAVSEYLDYYFKKSGYSSIVIPNSIDIKSYEFKRRTYLQPHILWVRSFHSDYNPNMAIDVLVKLLQKYPNASLCMVGPEKDSSLIEFKAYAEKNGLINKIKITGRLSKPEWRELSKSYDVFINTTNYDNTPVSVLEAIALGLPVVTTNVGGIPFLLKDSEEAFLVNKNDAQSMDQKITILLNNPDVVKRMTWCAYNKVNRFDWSHVKSSWFKLLNYENVQ